MYIYFCDISGYISVIYIIYILYNIIQIYIHICYIYQIICYNLQSDDPQTSTFILGSSPELQSHGPS